MSDYPEVTDFAGTAGPEHREFTLRGGLADGARFRLGTCGHGGWPDLGLGPKPGHDGPELLYRYDPAADTYVYIGQSEGFDGDA